jgi:hypothetical protein
VTNRGNKRNREAQYARLGHLDTTGGQLAYRKRVNHAGYTRYTISTNPTLYDPDGDVVSPTDSDNEHHAEPVQENPFGDVQLEVLLRPLTRASELPDHPSLSVPYKSRALTQMAEEAAEMARREREVLWKAKRLLRRFRGDPDWVPCETFETETDEMMLLPTNEGVGGIGEEDEGILQSAVPSMTVDTQSALDGEVDAMDATTEEVLPEPAEANGIEAMDMALQQAAVEAEKTAAEIGETTTDVKEDLPIDTTAPESVPIPTTETDDPPKDPTPNPEPAEANSDHTSTSGKETNNTNTHAMTTRARARSPGPSDMRASPTPSDSSIPTINPWFLAPPIANPDRDLGLPANEAEETRRILLLYVQKQEHIVRQLESLCAGLQKADRMRGEIYRACKAEGHVKDDGRGNIVTEMSDGEDWYDPTDWGLTERDLKMGRNGVLGLEKGRDEVEEAGEDEGGRRGKRRRVVNRM